MKIFKILHKNKVVQGKSMLWHTLIEKAQKEINDYEILNYLIKHMINSVIKNEERFKRSGNIERTMKYWFEAKQASKQDQEN